MQWTLLWAFTLAYITWFILCMIVKILHRYMEWYVQPPESIGINPYGFKPRHPPFLNAVFHGFIQYIIIYHLLPSFSMHESFAIGKNRSTCLRR